MSVLTAPVISAAATYIAARGALLNEMRRFCDAVHKGLEPPVSLVPKERKEIEEDIGIVHPSIVPFSRRYDLIDWRTYVGLTFYATMGGKSLRSVQLNVEFYSEDPEAIKRSRRRGLRTLTDVGKQFSWRRTNWAYLDGDPYIWIWDVIPRKLWLTNEAKTSAKAVTYTQRLLSRYLEGSKTASRQVTRLHFSCHCHILVIRLPRQFAHLGSAELPHPPPLLGWQGWQAGGRMSDVGYTPSEMV